MIIVLKAFLNAMKFAENESNLYLFTFFNPFFQENELMKILNKWDFYTDYCIMEHQINAATFTIMIIDQLKITWKCPALFNIAHRKTINKMKELSINVSFISAQ